MAYIIILFIVLGLVAYFVFKKKEEQAAGGYYVSTQGQSQERVKRLDLDTASEDASHILENNKLSFPKEKTDTEDVDYKADPEREWVINLIEVDGKGFHKAALSNIFDVSWRQNFPSTIYGFSPIDNRWTYVMAGGVPEIYNKIQIAIDVQEVYSGEELPYKRQKLDDYVIELKKRITEYPGNLKVEEVEPVSSAISKAKKLVALHHEFDIEAVIVLQSKSAFDGKLAWDVLQSVGLQWGDGDLFHWDNEEDYGDQAHFSVSTITSPGYFFPEDIKAGTMNPQDLVFSFSVPRSADPENIFSIMLEAVKYCQSRLGGTILDKNETPFNESEEKEGLGALVERMKKKQLIPGSGKVLRMF